jgi:hypothetical protein
MRCSLRADSRIARSSPWVSAAAGATAIDSRATACAPKERARENTGKEQKKLSHSGKNSCKNTQRLAHSAVANTESLCFLQEMNNSILGKK